MLVPIPWMDFPISWLLQSLPHPAMSCPLPLLYHHPLKVSRALSWRHLLLPHIPMCFACFCICHIHVQTNGDKGPQLTALSCSAFAKTISIVPILSEHRITFEPVSSAPVLFLRHTDQTEALIGNRTVFRIIAPSTHHLGLFHQMYQKP